MSKEPNNIDRLVREKLDGFEMTPPPSVWENTSASLQAGRKKRFFLWFVLGISAIALIGTGIYFYTSKNTPSEELLAGNKMHQTSTSTKVNSEGENTSGSNTNSKYSSGKNDLDSANELDGSGENTSNSDNTISSEDANGKRNFSSINMNITREEIEARERRKMLNDRSKNDGSLKYAGSDKTSLGDRNSGNQGSDGSNLNSGKSNSLTENSLGDNPLETDKTKKKSQGGSDKGQLDPTENILNQTFSLAVRPVELFEMDEQNPVASHFENKRLVMPTPLSKKLSFEGSFGISTFRNQADKKMADTSLHNLLSNAGSNRRSFDFSLGVNYHFTPRFSFQTGLEYSKSKEDYEINTYEMTTVQYFDSIATSLDSVTGDSIYTLISIIDSTTTNVVQKGTNLYKTLTIPFHFAWTQPIGARSKLEFALGGALNIYSQNSGSVILDTNSLIAAEQAYLKTGLLSLGGSVKYLYYFGNHHAVYIQPWAQFGITNQSTPALNYESIRRKYGIRVGYRFHL